MSVRNISLAPSIYPSLGLEELAEEIAPGSDCEWQLRLYSYDSKTAGSDVYKVPSDVDPYQLEADQDL